MEFQRIGICQNSFLLKIGICQYWNLSELEFVKIGIRILTNSYSDKLEQN